MGTFSLPCSGGGALRGTGLGLIPIHPVLHSAWPGTISPARLPPVTSDPTITAAVPGPFMPPACYYLQYLLLLIPLPAIVDAHTALLSDWKTQVLSFLLQQHRLNPPTLSKPHLEWKSPLYTTYLWLFDSEHKELHRRAAADE
ncbi:hypothetical protein PBY51_013989 [Eleginops maclovinus]|nr:hypothetical protein PBY51_013989 [Eleginops maclovinus]